MPLPRYIYACCASILLLTGCADIDKSSAKTEQTAKKDQEKLPGPKSEPLPAPRINPMTHIAAGQMLERQGDLNGAVEQYEKAVVANPKLGTGYNRMGIVYQKLGRLNDAEQMFRQGAEVQPRSSTIHNNLGYNHLLQKKLSEAERDFRAALAITPDFQRARMNLGMVLANQGQFDEALNEFSRVVSTDVANYNVAVVCMQKGDYTQSEKSLRQALVINPNCPGAKQQLERISRIVRTFPQLKKQEPSPVPAIPPMAGNPSQQDPPETP